MSFLTKIIPMILIAQLVPTFSNAAGFSPMDFQMISSGTVFFGVSPIFSASTYQVSNTSRYTSWGYQASGGYDYPLTGTFGVRGYASYGHAEGNNSANTDTTFEKINVNDIEVGGMATFNGWALGGGIISRGASFEYVNGQTSVSDDYSGLLKFAKASLDFTSQGGSVGFSISESYIFGNVGESNQVKVAEWRSLINIFYLLNLK